MTWDEPMDRVFLSINAPRTHVWSETSDYRIREITNVVM